MEINVNFDIENFMFIKFKEYMAKNSKFITDSTKQIFPKAPKQLATFPTLVFKENNNTNARRSLDRTRYDKSQIIDQITDTIEIYTTDMTVDGVRYASKTVMSELKYLVFDFFEIYGAERISCQPAEYSEHQVDRLVIVERYYHNNWNRMIY